MLTVILRVLPFLPANSWGGWVYESVVYVYFTCCKVFGCFDCHVIYLVCKYLQCGLALIFFEVRPRNHQELFCFFSKLVVASTINHSELLNNLAI